MPPSKQPETRIPGRGADIVVDVAGNRLTLLADGPERLDALIALIDGARRDLRILYYIFLADRSGTRVRDAMVAAAGRGVKVSLLIDGFGSTADSRFLQPLIDSDVRFCRFSARFGRRYLLRNHQKLALADGRRVIVGGFNVSDDYFGTVDSGAWRDIGLMVEGESVAELRQYFDDIFAWALSPGPRIRDLKAIFNRGSEGQPPGALRWLFGGPTRRLSPWALSVRKDMAGASRMDMIAAYFAPSPGMLRRIGGVARTARVRIVTAALTDNPATVGAARNTYWWLLKRNVRIFEYQPTKLHSKLFVLDDIVHVGSANFDMRSLYLNLEMMLRVEDRAFAEAMRGFFESELADSREITVESHRRQRSWFNRVRWWLAWFIVAVADYGISSRLNFGLDGDPSS